MQDISYYNSYFNISYFYCFSAFSPEILSFVVSQKGDPHIEWLFKKSYQKLVERKLYDRKVEDFKSAKEIFDYMLEHRKVESIKDLPLMVDELIKAANDTALDFFTYPVKKNPDQNGTK